MGLDRPLHVEYWQYIKSLMRGDFGLSLRTGAPVFPLLIHRLRLSLQMSLFACFLGLITSIPIGIVSAAYRNGKLDFFVRIGGLVGLSIPRFWSGTVILLLVTFYFPQVFRTVGSIGLEGGFLEAIRTIFLPALTLAITISAVLARLTRSSMLEVLRKDYIVTAHSKGLSKRVVLYKHALRNAMIPILTETGMQFGLALGGMVLVETVFTYPGLGLLIMRAIEQRDYTLLQGALVLIALVFTLVNLLIDLAYAYLDPRIRYE